MLKNSHGRITPELIKRVSRMVGLLLDEIHEHYESEVAERSANRSSGGKANYHTDLRKFVCEYKDDRLWDQVAGREHEAYPKYYHSEAPVNPAKFYRKLIQLSQLLDRYRNAMPDC